MRSAVRNDRRLQSLEAHSVLSDQPLQHVQDAVWGVGVVLVQQSDRPWLFPAQHQHELGVHRRAPFERDHRHALVVAVLEGVVRLLPPALRDDDLVDEQVARLELVWHVPQHTRPRPLVGVLEVLLQYVQLTNHRHSVPSSCH